MWVCVSIQLCIIQLCIIRYVSFNMEMYGLYVGVRLCVLCRHSRCMGLCCSFICCIGDIVRCVRGVCVCVVCVLGGGVCVWLVCVM